MRLLNLTLHDFRSYQDADIDLSGVQLASVVGPNGAGKSSLLEAAVFALTGAKGMRNLDAFIRQGCEECRVALTFSTGGETYRLTRTRSNRGSGKSTLELARQDESGLWAAEGTGARDTDERVRAILGVDEDTLLQTAIVAQGDAGSFFALRPAARLEALGSVLKLGERFGPLESQFKCQADTAKANLEQARRDVERLELDVERLADKQDMLAQQSTVVGGCEEAVSAAEDTLMWANEQLRIARDAAAGYELAVAKRDELFLERRRLAEQLNVLRQEADGLHGRIAQRADLEAELGRRGELEVSRDQELRHREKDQAAEADRRRLTDAVRMAGAELTRAIDDWTAAEGRKKAAAASLAAAQMKHERALMDVASIEARGRGIKDAARPICDRCGQAIQDEALAKTLAGIEADAEAASDHVNQAKDAIAEHEASVEAAGVDMAELIIRGTEAREVSKARKAELAALPAALHSPDRLASLERELAALAEIPAKLATIATLEERLAVVQSEAESLAVALADPEATDALVQAEQAVSAAQGAQGAVRTAEIAVRDAETGLRGARQSLSEAVRAAARTEGEVASLAPCRDQLAETQAAAKAHEQEQADAELLRKAMGKWGVPALIIGNVLLSLEVEVNELLSLYEGSLALRFEGEKETGNGARDSLEIIVFDGTDWRPFETFSGGERYRVASAMRLGLARLLAHRSGARVETLIVDEPEGLDAPGRMHLAAILARMAEDFGIVLLLTHYEDLKDAMPQQIVVSRGEDGLSRVEVVA